MNYNKELRERLIELYDFARKDNLVKNQKDFSEKIGITTQFFTELKNGRSNLTSEKLQNIKEPLSIYQEWLLTGRGEVPKADMRGTGDIKEVDNMMFINVPMVTIPAQAGYLLGYGDETYVSDLPTFPVITDRKFRGKYRVFEVEGDSMDDGTRKAICDGDKLLGREVKRDLWSSKLHIRDWNFIIIHRTEGFTVKQITEHRVEEGVIVCHPINPLFEDFELNLNDVVELYNVIKVVDRTMRI